MNKCLAESGIDPTDIPNVMPVSYAKRNISSHESSRRIQTNQRYVFARVNQSKHHNCDDLDPTDTPSAVPTSLLQDSIFDAYGELHHRDIQTLNSSFCDLPSLPPGEPITHAHMHDSNPAEEDSKSLSAVSSATKTSPNLRLDPPKWEDQPQDLTSDVFVYGRPNPDGSDNTPPMSIINFDDLLGSNRILSKVQKSFWSCTHVNSFQNYALYINLHILLMF